MTEVDQRTIWRFCEKHSPTEQQQFRALVEEVGELAEALNTDTDDGVAEELADIIFIARTLAEMRDINISEAVNEVTHENLAKDTSTDGDKITKSTVDGDKITKSTTDGDATMIGAEGTEWGVTDD